MSPTWSAHLLSGPEPRVVILDELPQRARAAAEQLGLLGLRAEHVADPDLALRAAVLPHAPALILLQRGRDPRVAEAFLRRLRAVSVLPCVWRVPPGAPEDAAERIRALDAGADDVVAGSMCHRETAARIRAVLRRAAPAEPAAGLPEDRPLGAGWTLSFRRRELFAGEARCLLTSAEFEMMAMMVRADGRPVSRDAMSLAVLRRRYNAEDRALDNLVLRVRRKCAQHGATGEVIKAVRGVGYAFIGVMAPAEAGSEAPAERAAA